MSDVPMRGNQSLAVYAIGGNALSNPSLKGSESAIASEKVMASVLEDVVDLLEAGIMVVMTHGNGPQVGEMLLMEEALFDRRMHDEEHDRAMTEGLDHWVAATQGTLGHEIATRLDNVLQRRGRHEQVVTLLTRVEVSDEDEAFSRPTKPIGPVIDDLDIVPNNWVLGITNLDTGPRRVVASPKPIRIIDLDAIDALVSAGAVVLCGGGGGIPVVSQKGGLKGIEAVIDKDWVSALLASSLNAEYLFISTAIDSVKINFQEDGEESISKLTVSEAKKHLLDNQFPAGSMGPKIEAMIFAKEKNPNLKAILCKPGDAIEAMRGVKGTTFLN